MSEIRPFRGVRPKNDLARYIIAPPYDVPSDAEAREIAGKDARSFLHITRPEVDLPPDADPHGPEAYAGAAAAFQRFLADGWLIRDENPCFYLYVQTWGRHVQTGLLAVCSVEEYDSGLIKQHELTRPDKEQDRVDHIQALDAQTGLVFLTYRDDPAVAALIQSAAESRVQWLVTTDDGVDHMLQAITDPLLIAKIQAAFRAVPALYVADGHHRSAAASRVSAALGGAGSSGWFLAGLFPDSALKVLAYNRLVKDLGAYSQDSFLAALAERFEVEPGVAAEPVERGQITCYLGGTWYGLRPKPEVVPDDPVGRLDVAVLQDQVLSPLLGIENPRTDPRIAFVGGIRGAGALSAAVDRGEAAVAFHLYPTGLDQLFEVADAGRLMPPKSTWFEPKLRGGVVIHPLDSQG